LQEGNGQGKFHPKTGHEGPEGEYRCSSTLSLTLVLVGMGDQLQTPAALPREDQLPIVQEAGWASEPVWTGAENISLHRFRFPDYPERTQSP
jgi:hypothetical protein